MGDEPRSCSRLCVSSKCGHFSSMGWLATEAGQGSIPPALSPFSGEHWKMFAPERG